MKKKFSKAKAQLEEVTEEKERLEKAMEKQKQQGGGGDARELKRKVKDLEEEMEALNNRITGEQEKSQKLQKKCAQLTEEIEEKDSEITKLKRKIKKLQADSD